VWREGEEVRRVFRDEDCTVRESVSCDERCALEFTFKFSRGGRGGGGLGEGREITD
jgi:hypothetical protein